MSDTTTEATTPGQAACETWQTRRLGVDRTGTWEALSVKARADWEAAADAAIDWWHKERDLEPPRTITATAPDVAAELADVRERADFYEAERDRERLAAEHHRTACVELEERLTEARAGLAAERERIRSAVDGLKAPLSRPGLGYGPGHAQAVEFVPLGALLALLGPQPDGDGTDGPSVKLGKVREEAQRWALLAPPDDWGDGGIAATVKADCGREILAVINGDGSQS